MSTGRFRRGHLAYGINTGALELLCPTFLKRIALKQMLHLAIFFQAGRRESSV